MRLQLVEAASTYKSVETEYKLEPMLPILQENKIKNPDRSTSQVSDENLLLITESILDAFAQSSQPQSKLFWRL